LDRALTPDIGTADALKQAVLQANALAYSTGPSGVALAALFAEWGIAQTIAPRIKIPPPGTPVASLLASGEVSLGFQQHAELIGVHGVHILGSLPASVAINTVFSAAVATQAANTVAAQQLVDALAAPSSAETKQRNGMRQPA
ncbi:MAG: substrate-binding domain-containing protein, partial [Comamonadaceae bacterium]